MVFAYPIISASFKWILRFLKIIYINLLGALLSLRNGEIQLYNDFLISDLVFFEMIWFFVVPLWFLGIPNRNLLHTSVMLVNKLVIVLSLHHKKNICHGMYIFPTSINFRFYLPQGFGKWWGLKNGIVIGRMPQICWILSSTMNLIF